MLRTAITADRTPHSTNLAPTHPSRARVAALGVLLLLAAACHDPDSLLQRATVPNPDGGSGSGGASGASGPGGAPDAGMDAGAAGGGGTMPVPKGLQLRRGGIHTLGGESRAGTLRLVRQRFESGARRCSGTLCVTGGLTP